MSGAERVALLFQYASEYRFDEFVALFGESVAHFSPAECREALLMRAQVKLFAADETFLDDLQKAREAQENLETQHISINPENAFRSFPCLNDCWTPDSSNRFVVFPKAPGALGRFVQVLPQANAVLLRLGAEGVIAMLRQIWSELLYFQGAFDEALRLATEEREDDPNCADAILLRYVRFRCNLALGRHEEAGACMLDMIRVSKSNVACVPSYWVVREWANLTTGWSGDTPRFRDTACGEEKPVLDDRQTAIHRGISRLSYSEEPFVAYAERQYRETCTMRQYYMDIFHAVYWFEADCLPQAEANFLRAYRIAASTDLIMPFVEYGRQILPLLRHVREAVESCPHDWIDRIFSLAERYEENLQAYRS